MAQPSGQVLVDSGHALAGFFAYAYDDGAGTAGMWDAQNGAMLAKTGTGAITTEGGAKVATSSGTTFYTLASAINLPEAFTIAFRARTTALNNKSMVMGNASTYIWLNDGSNNTRFSSPGIITSNPGSTTMSTVVITRAGLNQPCKLYEGGTLVGQVANSGSGALTVEWLLKAYTNAAYFIDGAAEWFYVAPAGTVFTDTQVADFSADPYQILQASGATDATAAGVTVAATSSIVAGSASGAVQGEAAGSTMTSAASFVAGAATGGAGSSITITSPTARTMRQRSLVTNAASVTISGAYTGSPGSIQYRFAGSAWQTLVASPSGGTYSQAVDLPTGQGALEVRHSADTGISASVALITVGDIYATAGQSNNVGAATSVVAPVATSFQPLEFLGGAWVDLREGTTTGTSYSGLSGYGGSYFGALANRFQSNGVPVGFIPCAQGSTFIANWQKGQSLYNTMLSRISAVGGVRAVIFWLGESDANNGTTQSAFETGLGQMVNDIMADVGLKTFVNKIVRWISAADTIRAAQDTVIAGNANVAGSADCDVYAPSGVHYLTTTDINNVADRVYAGMVAAFYGTDATAAGATLSASVSLLPGAAGGQASASAPGVTIAASVMLVAGSASGAGNAVASGATLLATATLLAGLAQGGSAVVAPGAVVSAVASFVPGSASGQRSASASGATLSVLVTWVAGGASDGSNVWPTGRAGITHRAIVQFTGVRAIVNSGDTAMVVKTLIKQPADVEVYEIDFDAKYLAGANDTASTLLAVTAEAGITVTPEVPVGGALSSGVVRVRVSGGDDGQAYKITARISTTGGREKEADVSVQVTEA